MLNHILRIICSKCRRAVRDYLEEVIDENSDSEHSDAEEVNRWEIRDAALELLDEVLDVYSSADESDKEDDEANAELEQDSEEIPEIPTTPKVDSKDAVNTSAPTSSTPNPRKRKFEEEGKGAEDAKMQKVDEDTVASSTTATVELASPNIAVTPMKKRKVDEDPETSDAQGLNTTEDKPRWELSEAARNILDELLEMLPGSEDSDIQETDNDDSLDISDTAILPLPLHVLNEETSANVMKTPLKKRKFDDDTQPAKAKMAKFDDENDDKENVSYNNA